MAYTALEKMRRLNEARFGRDIGPMQPALFDGAESGFDLKSAALRFLHERCENLRFDSEIEAEEARTEYSGLSTSQVVRRTSVSSVTDGETRRESEAVMWKGAE